MGLVFRLSKKNTKILGDGIDGHEVLARFHARKDLDLYAKTGIFCPERYTDHNGNVRITWLEDRVVVPRLSPKEAELRKVLTDVRDCLAELERLVADAWADVISRREKPGKSWLQDIIDGNTRNEAMQGTLAEVLDTYINEGHCKVTYGTLKHYMTMLNHVRAYEEANRTTWTLDGLTPNDLERFAAFVREGNSGNYTAAVMKKLRSFIRWTNGLGKDDRIEPLTNNNPFNLYKIESELYGTPYFLTIEERNRLADAELPKHLAVQRDIFIFQCLIGCRVSDLISLTEDDIIGGAVEYIPDKTITKNPRRVRVPLNERAREIVERYKGDGRLLPFISEQKYGKAIKAMLKEAGITRMVTVIDPKTRKEVKRPINEIASSHLARRTFIGNLYKMVKDPALVGKLSGHVEGSRAFARYRDIDEDMARELVAMLE